ncbi:MAG: amino acid deaminase/aldolase [Myxococcota bacterium]
MDSRDWRAWKELLADVPLPAALVDLDAMAENAALLLDRLGPPPVTLRIATKSLRCVAIIRRALTLCGARARGLMTYSARETAWLAREHGGDGFDDFLLAYPAARPDEARALVEAAARPGTRVRAMVDDPAHVALLVEAVAAAGGAVGQGGGGLTLCIDVDAAWRPVPSKHVHLGVRRSPIRTPEAAVALADRARDAGLVVDAVMAYEAQVAGMADDSRGGSWLDPVRRAIRTRSQPVVAARRRAVVAALAAAGHRIEVVNGGGTGSVAATAHDGSVSEVTVGSGFLASHLFDGYRGLPLRPAAFFALAVDRVPDAGFVTCFGGGYVASGATGRDRSPIVHAPTGWSVTGPEGWGEVQTPLAMAPGTPPLAIGDPVICRHAKSGEVFERFEACYLVSHGRLGDRVRTYRGEGRGFG